MKKTFKKIMALLLLLTITFTSLYSSLLQAESVKDEVIVETGEQSQPLIEEDVEIEEESIEEELIVEVSEETNTTTQENDLPTDEQQEVITPIETKTSDFENYFNEDDYIDLDLIDEVIVEENKDELALLLEQFNDEKNIVLNDEQIKQIVSGYSNPFENIMMARSFSFAFLNENINTKASINNFELSSVYDGTALFDTNDEPGNDSSSQNKIVRSFDKVVYRTSYSTISDDNLNPIHEGTFTFKAVLPVSSDIAQWDTNAMWWMENIVITTDENSSTIEGNINIKNQVVAPRVGTINWVIMVNEAKNNTPIPAPTFTMGINDTRLETKGEDLVVSAKPFVNAKIFYEGEFKEKPTFSLMLELLSNLPGKGKKGLEVLDSNSNIKLQISLNYDQKLLMYKNNSNEAISGYDESIVGRKIPIDDAGKQLITLFNKVYNGGDVSIVQNGNTLDVEISNFAFDKLTNKVTNISSKNNELLGEDFNDDSYPFGAYVFSVEKPKPTDSKQIFEAKIISLNAKSLGQESLSDYIESDNKATYLLGVPEGGGPGTSGGPVQRIQAVVVNPTTKQAFTLIGNDASRNIPPDYTVYPGELVRITQDTMMYKGVHRAYIETYWGLIKFDTNIFEALKDEEEYSSSVPCAQPAQKEFYWVAKTDKTGWIDEQEMYNAHISNVRNKNGYELFKTANEAIDSGYVVVGFLSKSMYVNPNYVFDTAGPGTYPALRVKADAILDPKTKAYNENNNPNRVGIILGELEGIDFNNNSFLRQNVYGSLGDELDMYRDHKFINLGFIKATYDINGNIVSPSRSNANGNTGGNYTHAPSLVGSSFYVQPYNTYVNKHILQKTNENVEKEVFNLDTNQNKVYFSIEAGTKSQIELKTLDTFTLSEIIPKYLLPINESSSIEEKWGIVYDGDIYQDETTNGKAGIIIKNYSKNATDSKTVTEILKITNKEKPTYKIIETKDESGNTIITWTFENYPASYKLPAINYVATIDKNVNYGEKINTKTTVYTRFAPKPNVANKGIVPVRIGGATIEKNALFPLRDETTPIGFNITFRNNDIFSDNNTSIDCISLDVLPYDNENNKGLVLEDYYLNNVSIKTTLYDENTSDDLKPTLTLFYTTKESEVVDKDSSNLILIEGKDKKLFEFSQSYFEKVELELTNADNAYSLSSKAIEDFKSSLQGKKITAIAIKCENVAKNSMYDYSYEYAWKDDIKQKQHQSYDTVFNSVRLAVASSIYQETIESAYSSPSINKNIVKINSEEGNDLNGKPVKTGDILTYRIFYSNPTDEVSIVKVFDEIPKGSTYVDNSATNNGVYNTSNKSLEWTFENVKPQESGFVEFAVKCDLNDEIKEIINTASVQINNNPKQNTQTIKNPKKIITAIKDSDPKPGSVVKEEDIITYFIKVKNTGKYDLDNVVVTDIIPTGTTLHSVNSTYNGRYDSVRNMVLFDSPLLKVDQEITVSFSVKVNKNQNVKTVKNLASYGYDNLANKDTNIVEHQLLVITQVPPQSVYTPVNTSSKSMLKLYGISIVASIILLKLVNKKRNNR